jgi:hypothetical protein
MERRHSTPLGTEGDFGGAWESLLERRLVETSLGRHDDQSALRRVYRDLDDAYAQIRALQSPQPQLASARNDVDRFRERDGDDDRRGRRSDRRRSRDD